MTKSGSISMARKATVDVSLNGLKVAFDRSSGAIVRMAYPGPGVLLEAEPGPPAPEGAEAPPAEETRKAGPKILGKIQLPQKKPKPEKAAPKPAVWAPAAVSEEEEEEV